MLGTAIAAILAALVIWDASAGAATTREPFVMRARAGAW